MTGRLQAFVPDLRRRAERYGTTLPDALLAAGLVPVSLVDMSAETTRWPLPAMLVAAPIVASLAWRRRYPVAVALALCLLNLALCATTPGDWPPQTMLFALLVAVYSAGAETYGRRALLVGASTLVLLHSGHVLTRDGDLLDFLPLVLWGAPWLAGRMVRRQTLAAAAAAQHAADVEHRREQDLRDARVRERDRIARELHDVVAHAVSLMVVQAGAERLRLGENAPQTRQVLDAVESTGRQALGDLRAMLGVLREPTPDSEGLTPQPQLSDLPALVEGVRAAGLPVQLQRSGSDEVAPALALSAYRIVQEALTNVLKHAGPVPTTVHVAATGGAVHVDVTSAMPAEVPQQRPADGRGLLGMHERAALHGGSVVCGPVRGAAGERWEVHAVLPAGAP